MVLIRNGILFEGFGLHDSTLGRIEVNMKSNTGYIATRPDTGPSEALVVQGQWMVTKRRAWAYLLQTGQDILSACTNLNMMHSSLQTYDHKEPQEHHRLGAS